MLITPKKPVVEKISLVQDDSDVVMLNSIEEVKQVPLEKSA